MFHTSDKDKLRLICKSWINDAENIFDLKKGDGVAYLVLYVFIPVIITWISLNTLLIDNISIIYCYLTILISALNSMYDAANRWNTKKKSLRNTKLFFILLSNIVVAAYCIYVIMFILISKNLNCRYDWILTSYFIAIIVAIIDATHCFTKDMALRQNV